MVDFKYLLMREADIQAGHEPQTYDAWLQERAAASAAVRGDFNLFCPALFTVTPPEALPMLRAVGGDGTLRGWRLTSPALVVLFDRKWRTFRITPEGGLEIATGSRKAWRTIDNDELLKRVGGIRTKSRIYYFKKERWHAERWLTPNQLASPYVMPLGGETREQMIAKRTGGECRKTVAD